MDTPGAVILFFVLIVYSTAKIISVTTLKETSENQTELKTELLESNEHSVNIANRNITEITTQSAAYLNKYSYVENGYESSGNEKKCQMAAKCELLEERTCLGAKLPYTQTSMVLSGFSNQQQARDSLTDLMSLQMIPRCWSVIQPFLCAILFPQCHNSTIQLPSQEMCLITKGPCRIIEEQGIWPEFLLCKESYPSKCKTASMDLPFNTSGECAAPLVSTKRVELWYDGFKGCGIQCSHPLFTDNEHENFQGFSYFMAVFSVCIGAVTVVTYILDWQVANKYPGIIIFYINVCYLFAAVGFLLQFKSSITCHSDGTRRLNEPSDGDISCALTFVMVYYFLMAAAMWFVILGYTVHLYYKSLVGGKSEMKIQPSYFHMIAWSLPSVLTIIVLGLSEVEGDPLIGICFLSNVIYVRIVFLLIPFAVMAVTGTVFVVKGLRQLVKLKLECSHIISENANKKIGFAIIRLSAFVVCVFLFLSSSIYFHTYTFTYREEWLDSLRDFILCTSKITKPNDYDVDCTVESRPSLNVYKIPLFSFFGFGFTISCWVWMSNTLSVWMRLVRRILGINTENSGHYSKREDIAQAFSKRKNLKNGGRISISLRSLQSDPAGLVFDMNSATSADTPSAWVAAIPHMMNRRGAMARTSSFHKRRNSIGSICSVQKRLSVDSIGNSRQTSRRHSLDSQISFHVSDVERRVALHTAARFGGRRKRNFLGSKKPQRFSFKKNRRASNTSDDSNQGSMLFEQMDNCGHDSLFTTMMKMVKTNSYDGEYRPAEDRPSNSEGIVKANSIPKSTKATVGVQTSLESIEQPRCIMVEKACQVSTPLLRKAAFDMDINGSNSSASSYQTERINV